MWEQKQKEMAKSKRVTLEEGADILWAAYDNSYRLILGEVGYMQLESEVLLGSGVLYLIHNRDLGVTEEDIEDMILWYEDGEMYERCGKLLRYQREKFS